MNHLLDSDDIDVVKYQRDTIAKAFNILIVTTQEVNSSLDLEDLTDLRLYKLISNAQKEALELLMELGVKK